MNTIHGRQLFFQFILCVLLLFTLLPTLAEAACTPTGQTAQLDATNTLYAGSPSKFGGDVSLWGAGSGIGSFDDFATYGDYVMYAGVDFGNGMDTFKVNIANGNTYTQKLELWVDGLPTGKGRKKGTKIGEVSVTPSGGWSNYVTYSGTVDVCSVHDLYLIPVTTNWEALGNVMWFSFALNGGGTPSTYSLAVDNGSGSGSYAAGSSVAISADTPTSGQVFAGWSGDTASVQDVNAASTLLVMPAQNVTVTATYENAPTSGSCTSTGQTAQKDALNQLYLGAPDATGGDVSPWGAGSGVGSFDDYATYGDYLMYAGMDFGTGVNQVSLSIANGNTYTQKLELWVDGLPGTGSKIGEVSVAPSGGWSNYVTYTGIVDVCSIHNLYLIPVTTNWEAVGNVMWMQFSSGGTTPQSYALTVTNGSGDGDYTAGTTVSIAADAPPANQTFAGWGGDTAGIADVNAASTTLTMPASNTSVTATYTPVLYSVTVNNGSGDGSYAVGATVSITADAPPTGQTFAGWSGDTSYLANTSAATTTLTMPAANVSVTATYKDENTTTTYTLTVNNGSGDESYAAGSYVTITADAPPAGQAFAAWTGDTGFVQDVNAANTLLIMPAQDVTVTATYTAVATAYTLVVNSGSGDGSYTAGTQVAITADAAPTGQTFTGWSGGTSYLADANAASTTLTMPAGSVSITATYANLSSCTATGLTPKIVATSQIYAGAPDETGGDVDPWGAGSGLGSFDDYATYGDYAMYAGLDFGNGVGQFEITVANNNSYNQRLELWVDGLPDTGTKLGEVLVSPTGSWSNYVSYSTSVNICGVHNLYLIPVTTNWEALGNIDWFTFSGTAQQSYPLTVNSGSGSGSYITGTSVTITADGATAGQVFNGWTGDVQYLADANANTTTLTMPASAATVTATYTTAVTYPVTVNSGSGSGNYVEGAVVSITANAAPAGQVFDSWSGDTAYVTDIHAVDTSLTMPASAITLTANYVTASYSLNVNNGSGDGSYTAGTIVNIQANPASAGQHFAGWSGDSLSAIADVNAASTTITMPASPTTISATYALDNPVSCTPTGLTAQKSAFTQMYLGDPDKSGGSVSLWGPTSGVGDFDDYALYGDYLMYSGMDFGNGASQVQLNAAVDATDNQTLELWVDGLPGAGTKIGEITIVPTGSWSTYTTFTGTVDVCSVHDLYLIPVTSSPWTGVGNLIWLSFKDTLNNLPPTASLSAAATSGQAPLIVKLDASASTDPEGLAMKARWDFSYDGTNFVAEEDNGSYLTTEGTFTKPGVHTVAVEVSDPSGAANIDTIDITVTGVDAGDRQTVLASEGATLAGSVSPTSSVTWSLVSGPGNVIFSNPQDINTQVSFPAGTGSYLLRLTANGLGLSDTVLIEVVDETPIIPATRRVDWSTAGVEGGIPANIPVRTTLTAQDLASNPISAIQTAIDNATSPGVVVLPEGTFNLNTSQTQMLNMRDGIVLRGQGMDKTRLVINAPNLFQRGAINISGNIDPTEYSLVSGYAEGSTQLKAATVTGLSVGDTILIYQDNDPVLMASERSDAGVGWDADWAQKVMSQIVKVTAISGSRIEIDVPLRRSFSSSRNTRFQIINPISNVGIEDLAIERANDDAEDFNIRFDYALNSWVRGVEFAYNKRAHIWVNTSRFITLESNYAHDTWKLGSGGYGYGFVAGQSVSDTLIWNNVFDRQGTSMMTKQGANGIVLAYNFVGSRQNQIATSDISLHGHYTYAVLSEGNVIDRIRASDWWGPDGYRITFFRNRIQSLYGGSGTLGLGIADRTHYMNVVGNTLLNGGGIHIEDDALHACYFTLQEGNLLNGNLTWNDMLASTIPTSQFLNQSPSFWGTKPWPAIGADVDGGSLTKIPAEEWYDAITANGSGIPFPAGGF